MDNHNNNISLRNSALFLGNALLDLSAQCDIKLLEKYKLKVDDNCEAEEWQLPIFNKLLSMPDVITTPGGSAQNSARIAQQLLLANKTGPQPAPIIYFVGCIGCDKSGRILEKEVNASGVTALYYYHLDESTGVSAGLVTSQSTRTLVANIGASSQLPLKFLDTSAVQRALRQSLIFYVEGYFLAHSTISAMSLAKYSQQYSANFFLGLSAVYIVSQHFEELMHLIQFADAIFGNKSEAQTFYTQLTGVSKCNDMHLIAQTIAKTHKSKQCSDIWSDVRRYVFVTQGCEPLIVAKCMTNGETVVNTYSIPVIDVSGGDTIGAGDAFVGAIVASLISRLSVEEAVNEAIRVSAKVCQNRGCVLK